MTKPSPYFARVLDYSQVRQTIALLNTVSDEHIPDPEPGAELFEVHAPDGDVVFSGALIAPNRYACRMHREVFDEKSAMGETDG